MQRQLDRLIRLHGPPEHIRSDNGSESKRSGDRLPQAARRASEASQFIHRELQLWLKERGIKTLYIEPGSPWQNGFIESFNARLRAECLEREQLWTLSEARVVIEDWRHQYNRIRPHRSLGYQTPKGFARDTSQAAASGRATPSLRPQLDVASLLERYFNPQPNCSRLTLPVGQFG